MTLYDLSHQLHVQSGFSGKQLEAITFATALGMAHYAGSEHQTYFKKRFQETLDDLDSEEVGQVVEFIAHEAGIKPEPVDINRI
ncbi:MAG: hypothetical protein KDJ69_12200 [Nitratireductor sp.]|nr:hypothetical protein [Nitratireductor sp.]